MSEFMKKHPIISLLMVGIVVDGVVNIAKVISVGRHLKELSDVKVTVTPISEEEEENEPAGDI